MTFKKNDNYYLIFKNLQKKNELNKKLYNKKHYKQKITNKNLMGVQHCQIYLN